MSILTFISSVFTASEDEITPKSTLPIVETSTTNVVSNPKVEEISTKELVEKIHKDFNSELNRILLDYDIKLESEQKYKSILEKGEVMRKLGFTSAKTAVSSKQEEDEINLAKSNLEALQYFQNKYPLYKFITRESVTSLCMKYDLYCGNSENYIDEIPDKNLKEIENFKIDDKVDGSWLMWSSWGISDTGTNYVDREKVNLINLTSQLIINGLKIVAPLRMFKGGTSFSRESRFESRWGDYVDNKGNLIPDPIVLKPVAYKDKEYYLIVSAWGDEASDELVINPKLN